MAVLNQIIAVEKGVKSRTCSEITELHRTSQKPDMFYGFVRTYQPNDEEGETFPQEKRKVQLNVDSQLTALNKTLTELLDITATKDWSNCNAFADVIIDDKTIIKDAPATFLLFMEKQINDIRTFVENLPVLDESEDWIKDDNSDLYKTNPVKTHKTKKIQRPIILSEATKEHPAQTQLITEDVVVGYWDTIKHSGAMPLPKKKKILENVENLSKAIKFAREKANSVEIDRKEVGSKIFGYLFNI